jgi:limonene-1,2-epoxide hydrolase
MNNLDQIFHIWKVLYAKNQDPKSVIEEFFHEDYTQSINGVVLNRPEYINHVIEQRKNIDVMEFECKIHMAQADKLFIIYDAKGRSIQGDEIIAEIISYFEFKDKKIFKIKGQVHLSKDDLATVDMN